MTPSLIGNTLYYRRAKKVHRYNRCMLNELSKFFLGITHDTTMMVTFFGTLAHDSNNKNFGAEMEKYISPELDNNEERWEVHFKGSKEVAPEPMLVEDAAATATEDIGKLVSAQPATTHATEATSTNDNNGSNNTGVSVPISHSPSITVSGGTAAAAVTTTPTIVPEHVTVAAAAGRPLNTLDDEEKHMISVCGEEIMFEAMKKMKQASPTTSLCLMPMGRTRGS